MEPLDNRFVFYEPVRSLKDMSAFRAALDFLAYKINNDDLAGDFGASSSNPYMKVLPIEYTNDAGTKITKTHAVYADTKSRSWILDANMQKMMRTLRVPEQIENVVGCFVVTIIKEVGHWLETHRDNGIFYKCERAVTSRENADIGSAFEVMTKERLNLLVWRQDATIDYEKTAREMVKNGNLDVFHRFDLMCHYYMVAELRNARDIWLEMQTKGSRIFIGSELIRHYNVIYWNSIISDEVPTVTKGLEEAINEAAGYGSANLSSIKFVFNRLPIEDRIESMCRYITENVPSRPHYITFMSPKSTDTAILSKYLLSMFDEEEQVTLFTKPGFIINFMKILAYSLVDLGNLLKFWLHVSNLADGSLFISVLREIGLFRWSGSGHMHELLVELWRCSPLPLKKFVYKLPEDNNFLYTFCIRPNYLSDKMFHLQPRKREDGILIEILTDAEPEFRKLLWHRYWTEIIDLSRAAHLKKIIDLCLPRSDMIELEKGIMTSDVFRTYFADLLSKGEYSDLNEFLEIFSCGEKSQINEFKRQLLESVDDLAPIVKCCEVTEESVNRLKNFLSDAFQEDPKRLVKFKVDAILACITSYNLKNLDTINDILSVSEYLCDEQTLAKLKEEILKKCVSLVENETLIDDSKDPALPMTFMWCLGNAGKVKEFRRTLLRKRKFIL